MAKKEYIKNELRRAARPRSESLRSSGAIVRQGQSGPSTDAEARAMIEAHAAAADLHVSAGQKSLWDLVVSLFGIDENGDVFVKDGRGFYSESFISAKGCDPEAGSGGGGIYEDDLWAILQGGGNEKIAANHIPSLSALSGKLANAQLAYDSISVAGVSVSLGEAVSTTQIAQALTGAGYKLTDTTYTLSSFGVNATAAELNKLDGLATTAAELGYLHGVKSPVQQQLDSKADKNALPSASDILTKLKGVDGDGSGLDADMLDGLQANRFVRAVNGGYVYATGEKPCIRILRFSRTSEKGWIRLTVLDSNNSALGCVAEYIVVCPYAAADEKPIELRCLWSSSYDMSSYLKAVRIDGTTFDIYYVPKNIATIAEFVCMIPYSDRNTQPVKIVDRTSEAAEMPDSFDYASGFVDLHFRGRLSEGSSIGSRLIWGQPFDGTQDVSGALTGVTSITASGTVSAKILTGNQFTLNDYSGPSITFNRTGSSYLLVTKPGSSLSIIFGESTYISPTYVFSEESFRPYNSETPATIGKSANRWKGLYAVNGSFSSALDVAGLSTLSGGVRTNMVTLVNGTKTATLNLDSDGNVHVSSGLYSDSFVSAKGSDPASGGGSLPDGLDVTAMWSVLAAGTSEQINVSHIPDMPSSKIYDLGNASVMRAVTLGSGTVGSGSKGIWLENGHPKVMNSTVGSRTQPVYLNGGTVTACSYFFGNSSGNVPVSNRTVNTDLNADLLDGWHGAAQSGKALKKNGYVYVPVVLDSYWCKLAEFTWGSITNNRDVTLLIHRNDGWAIVRIAARYANSGVEYVKLDIVAGRNILPDRLRLYYEDPSKDGKLELWVNCKTQWGRLNAVVLSETQFAGTETDIITMNAAQTTTEQELPDLPYVESKVEALDNDILGNAASASKVRSQLTVVHDGGSASSPAKTFNGSSAVTVTIPTTLPASDVYAWAKAATKPAYSWGEIGGKPSAFSPAPHTHTKDEITDFPATWAWSAISGKPATLAGYGITDGVNGATASGGLTAGVAGHALTVGVASGYAIPTSAQIGAWNAVAALFGVDSDGNVYVKDGKGFYGLSFVSSRGSDPEAGSGGGGGVTYGPAAVMQFDLVRPSRRHSATCHAGTVTDTTRSPHGVLTVSDLTPLLRFRGAKAGDGWSVEIYVRTSGGKNSKFRRVLSAPMSECTGDSQWKDTVYESVALPWSLMRIFFEKFDPTDGRFHSSAYEADTVGAAWADLVANRRNGSGRYSFSSLEKKKAGAGGSIHDTSTHLYAYARFGVRLASESLGIHGDMKTFTVSLRRATSTSKDNPYDLTFTMRTD